MGHYRSEMGFEDEDGEGAKAKETRLAQLAASNLVQGALTASSRALATSSDFDPDEWAHLFTAKAARCNAAFMLALGNVEMSNALHQIADAVDASATTE